MGSSINQKKKRRPGSWIPAFHRTSKYDYKTNSRAVKTKKKPVPIKKLKAEPRLNSYTDEVGTPAEIFEFFDQKLGFDADLCASQCNKKTRKYFSKNNSYLEQKDITWKRGWMSPPYSVDIFLFIEKAIQDSKSGKLVVCLLPYKKIKKYMKTLEDSSTILTISTSIMFYNWEKKEFYNKASMHDYIICIFGQTDIEFPSVLSFPDCSKKSTNRI